MQISLIQGWKMPLLVKIFPKSVISRLFSARKREIAVLFFFCSIFSTPLFSQDGNRGLADNSVNSNIPEEAFETRRLAQLNAERENEGKLLFQYARNLHASGLLRRSLDIFENFLILYPDHPWTFDALNECAEIYLKFSRTRDAVDYYIQSFRTAHNREKGELAYLQAGKILSDMGEAKEARRIFEELIKLKPASRVAQLAEVELNAIRFLSETGDEE